MIFKSLFVLLIPILLGYLILSLAWRAKDIWQFVLKIFLSVGVGFGINSSFYFIWLLLFNQQRKFEILQFVIVIPIIIFLIFRERKNWFAKKTINHRMTAGSFLLVTVLFAGICFFNDSFIKRSIMSPHGDRDAQAIWNLRARFIYRAGEDWQIAFSPDLDPRFHADYPLLIPLNIAWAWNFLNVETTRVPIVLAILYNFGVVGVMFGSLAFLKSVGQATIGSLTLMAMPLLFSTSIMQIADVPLAYYILAVTSSLLLYFFEKQAGFMVLAGLLTGFAAWTKNEGMLFALSGMIGCILFGIFDKNSRHICKYFGVGMAFPLAVVLYFKFTLAPPSDLLNNFSVASLIVRLLDLSHYLIVLKSIGLTLLNFSIWNFSSPVVLIGYLFLLGSRMKAPMKQGVYFVIPILTIQLIGYVLIYVLTPYNIQWHLYYSVERLMLHLMPSMVLLIFAAASTPEEILRDMWSAGKTDKTIV
jgi:hypothetical protein